MPLSYTQRKQRIPFGGSARIAERLGRASSWVAMVLKGAYRDRDVERELAKAMRPATTVTEAFGPADDPLRKPRAVAAV